MQDLKKKFQDSQKYSQKDLLVTLFLVVTKKLFYDEKWLFSNKPIWHRSPCEEMCGNWSKWDFRALFSEIYMNIEDSSIFEHNQTSAPIAQLAERWTFFI